MYHGPSIQVMCNHIDLYVKMSKVAQTCNTLWVQGSSILIKDYADTEIYDRGSKNLKQLMCNVW